MPNANYFPWEETKEDNVLPTGIYHMVVGLEDGEAQNSGKRMFKGQFTVKAPVEYQGMSYFENYVTGTDENLKGIVAGSFGTRNMKKMLKAAQVPPNNDVAMLCASANGAEVLVGILEYKEPDKDRDGNVNQYAGMPRNKITEYHRLGEREPKIAPKAGSAPGMPVGVMAPAAPVAPMAPAPVQAPPAQAAPTMPATPAPPQAAPAVPQMPVTAVAPAAPQAPAAPAAPTASQGEMSFPCSICGQLVPASQLGAHVQQHVANGGR